jgi:predicted MPP superfamily phosphohydrolase
MGVLLWKIAAMLKGRDQKKQDPANSERRVFMKQGASYTLAGAAFLLSGAGVRNAFASPMIKEVILPVKGLHPDLAGFSIVQITDIHLGPTLKRDFMESVVNQVNRLEPDLIALTGDLVDGYVSRLSHDAEPLKDLSAPYGKFFVTRNHEYYFKALEWIDHMESLGFTTLNNAHRLIQRNDGKILLGGVTDLRGERFIPAHKTDPFKAMEGAPESHVRILLAHQPNSVYEAEKAGFDIQISGHTHGGQMFPWTYIVGLNQPFLAGLYTYGKTRVYVSRGTGYWGPPMRLGSPSEITRIVLMPEKGIPH